MLCEVCHLTSILCWLPGAKIYQKLQQTLVVELHLSTLLAAAGIGQKWVDFQMYRF